MGLRIPCMCVFRGELVTLPDWFPQYGGGWGYSVQNYLGWDFICEVLLRVRAEFVDNLFLLLSI